MLIRYWKSWIIAGVIFTLCLMPSSGLPELNVLEFRFADLVIHFLMFLVFSAILYADLMKYPYNRHKFLSPLVMALSICLLTGITTEMLQFLLASLNRTANLYDLVFDSAGSLTGIVAMRIIKRRSYPGF